MVDHTYSELLDIINTIDKGNYSNKKLMELEKKKAYLEDMFNPEDCHMVDKISLIYNNIGKMGYERNIYGTKATSVCCIARQFKMTLPEYIKHIYKPDDWAIAYKHIPKHLF